MNMNIIQNFDRILKEATEKIHSRYILVPTVAGHKYRERVYCYELYHQLRILWPSSNTHILNGELDKTQNPVFTNEKVKNIKPDFLVHTPGGWTQTKTRNYIAIEVKPGAANLGDIRSDIKTLNDIMVIAGYTRGMLLIYYHETMPDKWAKQLKLLIRRLHKIAREHTSERSIEVWTHLCGTQASILAELIGSKCVIKTANSLNRQLQSASASSRTQ